MTEFYPDWKNLPFEILQKVFQSSREKSLPKLTLVCKAWSHPAQAVLYSNISIDTLPKLKKFHDTVKHNKHAGNMVKKFFLWIPENMDKNTRTEAYNYMTTLLSTFLPRLEVLSMRNIGSYIPVLDALMDSKLNRLRSIDCPSTRLEKGEIANYVTCALLMKERITSNSITDDFNIVGSLLNIEQIYLNRLYDKLHQFNKLTYVLINRKTDEPIQELERIVESCRSLKNIRCIFKPLSTYYITSPPTNNSISVDTITSFVPTSVIETLNFYDNRILDDKTLIYIMHKFPHLPEFYLRAIPSSPHELSHQVLTQLFYYMCRIKKFSASGLNASQNNIANAVGNFWDATSTFGSDEIDIYYSAHDTRETLELQKSEVANKIIPGLRYPLSNIQQRHSNFIEKNGKYVGTMRFYSSSNGTTVSNKCFPPESFLAHTITHCTNLRVLEFGRCFLKKYPTRTAIDDSKKASLDELSLNECIVQIGALEQYSLFFSEIKLLRVYCCTYRPNKDPISGSDAPHQIKLVMPHTKIDLILLEVLCDEYFHIKLYVTSEKKYYYYHYDYLHTDGRLDVSTAKEYTNVREWEQLYIRCKTKPSIEIKVIGGDEDEDDYLD